MDELHELIRRLRAGDYTRAELMPRIARLGDVYTAPAIFAALPQDVRTTFCEWVRLCPPEGWGAPIGSIGVEPSKEIMLEFKRLAQGPSESPQG